MKVLTNDWCEGWLKLYAPEATVMKKRKRAQWKRITAALARVTESGRKRRGK